MRIIVAVLALLLFAAPVQAAPKKFTCTEGFGLYETMNGFELSGTLQTPTPGYSYEFGELTASHDSGLEITMKLIAPKGAVIQVLSSIKIGYSFETGDVREIDALQSFDVNIERDADWLPSKITCER